MSREERFVDNRALEFALSLGPHLHFGQISAREVAVVVEQSDAPREAREAFLEQLIVRRELSDNFCHYNPHYDSFEGFPRWAQESLRKHEKDERAYLYTYDQLDRAQTHDPLWNAAQNQLVKRGKLHGCSPSRILTPPRQRK